MKKFSKAMIASLNAKIYTDVVQNRNTIELEKYGISLHQGGEKYGRKYY